MNAASWRRSLAAIGCAAAMAVVAACSGGAPGGSGSSDSPIKIGVLAELTGTFSTEAVGVKDVANAWQSWINTQGGINGHPVEVVLKDTKSQASSAAAAARELVEKDQVQVVTVESGLAAPAVWDYLSSKSIPLLGSDNGTRTDTAPSTYFTTDIGFPALAEGGAIAAKAAGDDSVASTVCSEVAGCQVFGQTLGQYAGKAGVAYKGTVSLSATATDATAQCLQLTGSGTKSIALSLVLVPAKNLVDSCRRQGYQGNFIVFASSKSNFDKIGTGRMLGVSYDFPWWADAPPAQKFRDVMKQYNVDYYFSFYATNMWATWSLLTKAMTSNGPAAGKPVTGADVTAALRAGVKNETLDGLLAQPLTFAESGNTQVTCFWPIERTADGTFKTLPVTGKAGNGATGDLASSCV